MSMTPTIPVFPSSGAALIASPDGAFRAEVLHQLNGRCRPVQQASGGAEALAKLERGEWKVLFLDRCLPDLDADEVTRIIHGRFPAIQVVLLDSTHARVIEEPPRAAFVPDAAVASSQPRSESVQILPPGSEPLPGMIGSGMAMQRVYRLTRLVARRSTTVLVTGATGTGKELLARALHSLSPRSSKPLVVVNCAAIPESLLESELFGYTRGAFTGAVQSQLGKIPAAQGGTLFLDEISELPLGMQAKLLRFLEQKEIQRLGTCEVTKVDVRVIAASNVDLGQRAAYGTFRQDLLYRLSAFPIELPSLAERKADIVSLAEYFLTSMAASLDMPPPHLSLEAIHVLESHCWTGNVRELQHVIERASILVENGNTIEACHLYFPFTHCDRPPQSSPTVLEKSYSLPRQLA
jgi:transcriptional regulator with PAS, ATPase and Fis domain/CheY-like chemotaxis protein